MAFEGLVYHHHFIVALFLPILYLRSWKGTWDFRGSEFSSGTVRGLEREYKEEWDRKKSVSMADKLQQVSEESSGRRWDIMRKCLYRARSIPYMSNGNQNENSPKLIKYTIG